MSPFLFSLKRIKILIYRVNYILDYYFLFYYVHIMYLLLPIKTCISRVNFDRSKPTVCTILN